MTGNENSSKKNRIVYIDNLRMFMIFLVVFVHAGFVYDSSLSFLWIVNDPAKNRLFFTLFMIIDIFMMPTIFFVSGYFTPLSLNKNKGLGFIISKFKRLMIPWIIAAVTLIPLYKIIFLYTRNLPMENWTNYFHFTGKILINQGWLWFLPVLFFFNIVYFLFSKIKLLKVKFSFSHIISALFIIGVLYSFCMIIFKLQGWTKTALLDFQNERLLIYFLTFFSGAVCCKQKNLQTKSGNKILYFIILFLIVLPVIIYIMFQRHFYMYQGAKYIISRFADSMIIAFSFHLSLLGILYVMINTFRYFLNRKGRLIEILNNNSYGVYIIHLIVTGGIACILLYISIPSILKWVILTVLTFLISNVILYIYHNIMRKIIKKT